MERGAKREAVLAAAHSTLSEAGAAGLTLERVLQQAGAGTGTFYHHFPEGRTQLVAEVYARAQRRYEEGVLRVLGRNRDAQTGVKALVHHHLRLVTSESDLLRVLLHNRGAESAAGGRAFQRALQAWASAAGIPPQPAAQLVALWLGPVLEWSRLALQAGGGGASEAAADRLAQAAWEAVGSA